MNVDDDRLMIVERFDVVVQVRKQSGDDDVQVEDDCTKKGRAMYKYSNLNRLKIKRDEESM